MSESRQVEQIEYRWHPQKDMSPVASSLPGESIRRWEPRIRHWVRHPNVDAPSESVCYQVFGARSAALAWRYRDQAVAQAEGGAEGRPVVSRVLVGPLSVLTPDVAIVLCRAGLPASAGPPAGQAGASLPAIRGGELIALARAQASRLDREAAQSRELREVIAAALSDLDTPLAIQLPDALILQTPRQAVQSQLLWGLRRIVWPLTEGTTARRGWSFSTFELPMGDMETVTLPDVVFRQALAAPAAPPVSARPEVRIRPGDPGAGVTEDRFVVELADWLVCQYQETDGTDLSRFIAACTAGQPLQSRLAAVHYELAARWSPMPASEVPAATAPPQPEDVLTQHTEDMLTQHTAPPEMAPARPDQPAAGDGVPYRDQGHDYRDEAAPAYAFGQSDARGFQDPTGYSDVAQFAETSQVSAAPQQPAPDRARADWGGYSPHPVLGDLLEDLSAETDRQAFDLVLRDLLHFSASSEERIRARQRMPALEWCVPAFVRHGYKDCVAELAEVFRIVVIPDVARPGVGTVLGNWVREAPVLVTAALLAAAKTDDEIQHAGGGTFQLITAAIGPAGLQKLLEVSGIAFDWPGPMHAPRSREHHASTTLTARVRGLLGRKDQP